MCVHPWLNLVVPVWPPIRSAFSASDYCPLEKFSTLSPVLNPRVPHHFGINRMLNAKPGA